MSNPSPQKSPARTRNRFLIIAGSAIILAIIAFLVTKNVEQKDDIVELTGKMDELSVEITSLENNIQSLETELNTENAKNQDLSEELQKREDLLNEYKDKVKKLQASKKISDEQAAQLQSRVKSLEYYIRNYEKQVDELKAELEVERAKTKVLEGNVAQLEDKNFDLEHKNTLNETMLEAGAILKAADFTFARVKENGKEETELPFRGGRLDQLRMHFNIRENIFTKTGSRTLYIALYGPGGKPIQDMNGGSGYFTYDDRDTPFTIKKQINFKRDELPVAVDFVRPENFDFEDGQHVVKVYCDGFHIGSGTFAVK